MFMTKVEEMIRLNAKEEVAWKKWEETRDIRYMNQIQSYLSRRAKLIDSRTNDYALQEDYDEEER